ncbi:hypothetical protein MHYP_G00177940 [Metynnis hypsauchen]
MLVCDRSRLQPKRLNRVIFRLLIYESAEELNLSEVGSEKAFPVPWNRESSEIHLAVIPTLGWLSLIFYHNLRHPASPDS